jgi:hypothetical protein
MIKQTCAALLLLASSAVAEDMKQGWGFQFRQDTFDRTVTPLSMMSEQGDSFDKAMIAVACGPNGQLISFFQPGAMVAFDKSAKVQFRAGDETIEANFQSGDVPYLSQRLMLPPEQTQKVLDLFTKADGQDVAFRSDKKQGSFSSIAAGRIFDLVKQNCPTK